MTYRLSLISLGLAAWLTTSAVAADVEVLARGPVHEAYAEPSEREPAPTPVVPKEPPKAIDELPPDQKPEGDNVQWMPGYWAWDEDKKDFIWISGFWRNAPPGRTWVPGSWRKAGDGWQWSGGFWADAKGAEKAQLEYLPQPPKPLDDAGATTPQPSESHVYVPGSWVWRDHYVWRPGFWTEYRPGWVWVAAHYRWTPAGYVFIDGYWDYPLVERGILFAPAYIPPAVYAVPTFVYTPTIVVREECLFGAFFCRRGFGCYYFGDYFAPAYASIGFVSWCGHAGISVSIGGWYDPLFSYYRCGFRHDPFWRGGIHDLYAGRYRGDYMRPPTTFVQQTTVINNITNINKSKNVNLNNVTMLSSLKEAPRPGKRNLTTISDADRRAQQQSARGVREIANRRAGAKTTLAAKPAAKNTARSLSLDVPKTPAMARTGSIPPTHGAGVGTTFPKGPKPTPIGKLGPKSTGTPSLKSGNLPGINPVPKGPTNVSPKSGFIPKLDPRPTPRIEPKSSGLTPKSPLNLPPGPKSGFSGSPKSFTGQPPINLPPPKSAGSSPPAKSPPPKSPKPRAAAPTPQQYRPQFGSAAGQSAFAARSAATASINRSGSRLSLPSNSHSAMRPSFPGYSGRSLQPSMSGYGRSINRPSMPSYSHSAARPSMSSLGRSSAMSRPSITAPSRPSNGRREKH